MKGSSVKRIPFQNGFRQLNSDTGSVDNSNSTATLEAKGQWRNNLKFLRKLISNLEFYIPQSRVSIDYKLFRYWSLKIFMSHTSYQEETRRQATSSWRTTSGNPGNGKLQDNRSRKWPVYMGARWWKVLGGVPLTKRWI